jgi:hypothetical protein
MLTSGEDYQIRELERQLTRLRAEIRQMEHILSVKRSLAAGLQSRIEEKYETRRRTARNLEIETR